MVTEVHRAQQTIWQELIQTDTGEERTFRFIDRQFVCIIY